MKDYDAIVKADWQRFDDEERQRAIKAFRTGENGGSRVYTRTYTDEELEAHERMRKDAEDFYGHLIPDLDLSEEELLNLIADSAVCRPSSDFRGYAWSCAKEVLKMCSDCVADEIAEAMPNNLNTLFDGDGYFAKKHQVAIEMRKEINAIIKWMSGRVKNLGSSCPDIVKQPLFDALETAKAYVKLIDSELAESKYNTKHEEYKALTSHPIWRDIIVKMVNIIKAHKSPYWSESEFVLTFKLLAAMYPWWWEDSNAEIVRKRYQYAMGEI